MKTLQHPDRIVPPINEKSDQIILVLSKFIDGDTLSIATKMDGYYVFRGICIGGGVMDDLETWGTRYNNENHSSLLSLMIGKCRFQRYQDHIFYLLESHEDILYIIDNFDLHDTPFSEELLELSKKFPAVIFNENL